MCVIVRDKKSEERLLLKQSLSTVLLLLCSQISFLSSSIKDASIECPLRVASIVTRTDVCISFPFLHDTCILAQSGYFLCAHRDSPDPCFCLHEHCRWSKGTHMTQQPTILNAQRSPRLTFLLSLSLLVPSSPYSKEPAFTACASWSSPLLTISTHASIAYIKVPIGRNKSTIQIYTHIW